MAQWDLRAPVDKQANVEGTVTATQRLQLTYSKPPTKRSKQQSRNADVEPRRLDGKAKASWALKSPASRVHRVRQAPGASEARQAPGASEARKATWDLEGLKGWQAKEDLKAREGLQAKEDLQARKGLEGMRTNHEDQGQGLGRGGLRRGGQGQGRGAQRPATQ